MKSGAALLGSKSVSLLGVCQLPSGDKVIAAAILLLLANFKAGDN